MALLARGILADSKALERAAALGFACAGHPAGMYPPGMLRVACSTQACAGAGSVPAERAPAHGREGGEKRGILW